MVEENKQELKVERWLVDMSQNGFLILFLMRVWTIPHFVQ